MSDPRTYAKALAALLVAVAIAALTAYQAVAADGMTSADWVTVGLAALGVLAVYLTPNREQP